MQKSQLVRAGFFFFHSAQTSGTPWEEIRAEVLREEIRTEEIQEIIADFYGIPKEKLDWIWA